MKAPTRPRPSARSMAATPISGFADAGQAALAISKGAKVKIIASYLQKTQGVVISYAALGIKKPADLIGKTVALTNGSSSASLLLAMLALSDVPLDKNSNKAIASAAKVPAVLQGQVQAVTGFATAECIQAQNAGEISDFLSADGQLRRNRAGREPDRQRQPYQQRSRTPEKIRAGNEPWMGGRLERPFPLPAEAGVALFPLANANLLKTQLAAVVPYLHTKATTGKTARLHGGLRLGADLGVSPQI